MRVPTKFRLWLVAAAALNGLAMGRYEDELVKRDGTWLFSKRIVVTDTNTKWEP